MWFEIRYLFAAPIMLALYVQYVIVFRIKSHGGWWLSPIWVPCGLVFVVCNIAFNWTVGTFIFWDRPRQFFFSDRIRAIEDERKLRFQRLLNAHDEGHIE